VAAHHDDPLGVHLLRRHHGQKADRAVAHDAHGEAGLDVGGVGC
jgi:hypothetical protein